jgi:hypothetical protein
MKCPKRGCCEVGDFYVKYRCWRCGGVDPDAKITELQRQLDEAQKEIDLEKSKYAEVWAAQRACNEALLEREKEISDLKSRHEKFFDLVSYINHQKAWSEETFGPGYRTEAICDHIQKEIKEIKNDPLDISEWIDIVILGLDGAWRSGHTSEQIVYALVVKQTTNINRIWPDWRLQPKDKAIEHIRNEGEKP